MFHFSIAETNFLNRNWSTTNNSCYLFCRFLMSKMKFASPLEGADGASEGFNRVDNIEWHKQNRSKCCSEELLANEFRGLMFILGLKEKKVKISLLHVIKSLAQNLVIVTILLLLFILSECNFFPNPLSGYPKKLKKNKDCPLQLLQADCCDYWFQSAQCNNNATVSYGQLWYWVIFFAWLIYLLSTLRV